jgi:hypothetical protein
MKKDGCPYGTEKGKGESPRNEAIPSNEIDMNSKADSPGRRKRGVPVPEDYPLLDERQRYRATCVEPCWRDPRSGRITCPYRLETGATICEFFGVTPDPEGDPEYPFRIEKRSKLAKRLRKIGAREFTWDVFVGMVAEISVETVTTTWRPGGGPPIPRSNGEGNFSRVRDVECIFILPEASRGEEDTGTENREHFSSEQSDSGQFTSSQANPRHTKSYHTRVRDTDYRTQGTDYGVQDTEYGLRGLKNKSPESQRSREDIQAEWDATLRQPGEEG